MANVKSLNTSFTDKQTTIAACAYLATDSSGKMDWNLFTSLAGYKTENSARVSLYVTRKAMESTLTRANDGGKEASKSSATAASRAPKKRGRTDDGAEAVKVAPRSKKAPKTKNEAARKTQVVVKTEHVGSDDDVV